MLAAMAVGANSKFQRESVLFQPHRSIGSRKIKKYSRNREFVKLGWIL